MGENGSQGGSWFIPSSVHPLFLSKLSPSTDLAVAVFLTFTGVTSVLGNSTVLLVNCWKRKKLRPPELMTINLALCDFGFSFFGAPFFIISSLCHAWVFGEAGCLWYGIQGFVFGIGSLLTTCLISVDRCLKICCLRYGQWIERSHVSLSIVLLWVYTLFWALLPAFGFGSYGVEPYGTSCTINWWRMRSSMIDRIYVVLILVLCFGFPTITILTSYLAILLTVYRSNRTLASIPSSVSHTSKDLKLAKMAAVMCATFLVAWTPYAAVSLISALSSGDDQDANNTGMASSSHNALKVLDIPSLLNWTTTEYYRQIFNNSGNNTSSAMFRANLGKHAEPMTKSPSSFPPIITLIPAMFAKSHCMINPLIYQIMNQEFRDDVCVMVFGQETAAKRRVRRTRDSISERSISLSYCQSWNKKRGNTMSSSLKRKDRNLSRQKALGSCSGTESWADNISEDADAVD